MRSGFDALETLSPEELQDRITLPRLIASLRSAAMASPYWREFFRQAAVDVRSILAFDSFAALPLTDKPQFLDDQQAHPPFGRLLAVPRAKLRRLHRTSGSTARPLIVLLTARDILTTIKAGARALRCAGVGEDDLVIHCLNYSMWSGGVTDHLCFERAGATVIPFGTGNSAYLITTIRRLRPTAISCTPSYLSRLDEVCTRELGSGPAALGLKSAFLGGEGGLQEPAYRAALEQRWQMRAVDANYGMSDVLSIFGSECRERRGLHFHGQGVLHPELIDEASRPLEIARGHRGELVLTCLLREAQPLFRYRTHDLVEILGTSCGCGRTGFLFRVLGRTDDMVVVKGVNFFPSAVQAILERYGGSLNGEYRVVVFKGRPEAITLRAELRPDVPPEPELALRIASGIRSELAVSLTVELAPTGSLPRTGNKVSRLVHE